MGVREDMSNGKTAVTEVRCLLLTDTEVIPAVKNPAVVATGFLEGTDNWSAYKIRLS